MREIVYKNLTGKDKNRRDLYVKELVSKDGVLARIERKCSYFIRKKIYIEDPNDLESLNLLKRSKNAWKKKHFHVLRRHNSNTGEDTLICKVASTFYAIVGHYVFCIAFVHQFKMDLAVVAVSKEPV